MVMGDLVREVDVAVVGGGPGGYTAAFRCAELGLETVVVDAAGRLGGACLWEGCIPSKALLHVAAVLGLAAEAREFGVDFGEPQVALDTLRKWKAERVVGRLARGLASLARARGVEVVAGRAVFEDARTLRVEGDDLRRLRFRHAVVATGAAPVPLAELVPEAAALAGSERVLDAAAALELPEIPERLLVVGVDYIGVELAEIYAALGSRVTLAMTADALLPGVDRDLLQPLVRHCERRFEGLRVGVELERLREVGGAVEARFGGTTAEFDRVVVAAGRRPASAGLGLEATRARVDAAGAVVVDARCRTDDPHVYAVGDVTGEPMLAHRAMRQGVVAAEALAGRPLAFDNVAIPAVVFTDPEVAWCGLGEEEAGRRGRPVRVATVAWAASGRAATRGRADGLTKLVADPESGRLLGVGIVGPGAAELIGEAALALEAALTAEDLAATIHAHPTLAESLMEAAARLAR